MADDFAVRAKIIARETAREVINQLHNENGLVSLEEAKQILVAENDNVSEYRCANCRAPIPDPTISKCPSCGSRAAIISSNSPYRCERCGRPVDLSDPECVCGHTRAIPAAAKTNPVFHTCQNCLKPVAISQPQCNSCGSTRCVRTIEV